MQVADLGTLDYRSAWEIQEKAHAEVLEGGEERLLLVEHPPVITLGRRPGIERNMLVSEEQLAAMGVELVQSDRGGDITFHGPGQLVIYPIIRLNDHRLSVSGYVHRLEAAVIGALAEWGISGYTDASAVGVWVNVIHLPAKVCAIGVRIRRGVSLHGLALNVSTNLDYFNLIIPCGLTGRSLTSLENLLPGQTPSISDVKDVVCRNLTENLTASVSSAGISANG